MFLECKVDGTTLYATFWGYHSPNYDVIKTRNKVESRGDKTYKVRAWRDYYKNGKKVDEEELFTSTYDYGGAVDFIDASTDDGAEDVGNSTAGDYSVQTTTEAADTGTSDNQTNDTDTNQNNNDSAQDSTTAVVEGTESPNTDTQNVDTSLTSTTG